MIHTAHILIAAYVAWYLAAHATLTKPLWSRYPPWLDAWAGCSACAGAWWTLGAAALAKYTRGWLFFGLDALRWPGALLVLACGCVAIPLLAAPHLHAVDVSRPLPLVPTVVPTAPVTDKVP